MAEEVEPSPENRNYLWAVLDRVDVFNKNVEEDIAWNGLSAEQKEAIQNFEYLDSDYKLHIRLDRIDKRKLWNLVKTRTKNILMGQQPAAENELWSLSLEKAAEEIERYCLQIDNGLQNHIENAEKTMKDPHTLKLLRFYGHFFNRNIPKASSRQSAGAVGGSDDTSSASSVGTTLEADQIHYNMFGDESEVHYQRFKRFEMGQDPESDASKEEGKARSELDCIMRRMGLEDDSRKILSEFLDDALENLNCARCFLSSRQPPTLEKLTKFVFSAFLEDLVEKMEVAFAGTNAAVVAVSSMDTVNQEVEVCKTYMERNAKRRKMKWGKGNKKTTLRIESDLAIIEGRPGDERYVADGANPAKQYKQMFLLSKVNVEMKQWDLLRPNTNRSREQKKNRTPLTQVSAESMVRGLKLKEEDTEMPETLFSLLTDCSLLYCVHHHVQSKEYWISRSVSSPEEILVGICWLFLCSFGMVKAEISKWEYQEEDLDSNNAPEGEHKSNSVLDSVGEGDQDDDETDSNPDVKCPKNTNTGHSVSLSVLTFQDDDEMDDQHGWETVFLMHNHRKYGAPLPLTEGILSLHNNQMSGQDE